MTGVARRATDFADPDLLARMGSDAVLVMPRHMIPYADWHALLMLVRGVVCAGRLSHHLAQVARECGLLRAACSALQTRVGPGAH